MEIRLQKPIDKNGAKLETITLDLDRLSGNDIIKAEQEARVRGDTSPNPLFSSLGCAVVAAKASGWIADDVMALPAPDFLLVTNTVSNFFVRMGLADTGSVGELRRVVLSMAQYAYTSVDFWLGMTLRELSDWVKVAVEKAGEK